MTEKTKVISNSNLKIIQRLREFTNNEWDIFEDLITAIEEDEDKIYILAEDISDAGRSAMYNILYNIVNTAVNSLEYKYFRANFVDFEIELSDAIKMIEEYNKEYDYAGDDNWIYAIHSMKLPLEIKTFCEAFDRYDIINWIDNSKTCQRAIKLYWKLEGIWDFINVRHRQSYGDNYDE